MQKQTVLIVGSGGREHAIALALSKSKKIGKIFCAPGNAGTATIAENIPISAEDITALANFAAEKKIDLTVVGPEAPLVNGIVDSFESRKLKIFGPNKNAAIIEGSKSFTRDLLKKYNIPSAEYVVFTEAEKALAYLKQKCVPIVVKADGLAAGKGVIVCQTMQEAEDAIKKILVEKAFGEAGNKLILEEFLDGEEASYLAFSDGESIKPMASAQDHKRALDNDVGANTGGMGAYSPAPVVTEKLEKEVLETIMFPTIQAMKKEGREYKGVLYAGLMITEQGPKVLEFNARFGDPETQVILPRLKGDLFEILLACIDGSLEKQKVSWSKEACTCVVLASGGYPEHYEKGIEIFGLDAAAKVNHAVVFHAGTKLENKKVLTNGGRVLGVTALGKTIKDSIQTAYAAVEKISFEKMHYRKDIGHRALERERQNKKLV
jgi:phosphoribosylamine--glycine ligase